MSTTFVIGDTHFYHKATLKPDHCNRPFANVEEMNEHMVALWNATVKPADTVYHLGDVAMWKPEQLSIVSRLNGAKFLIPGNHDPWMASTFVQAGFRDVLGMKEFGGDGKGRGELILTHIPVHPMSLRSPGGWETNVHGHIHGNRVMTTGNPHKGEEDVIVIDPRYFCVSVEHTGYRPWSLEELRAAIARQRRVLYE